MTRSKHKKRDLDADVRKTCTQVDCSNARMAELKTQVRELEIPLKQAVRKESVAMSRCLLLYYEHTMIWKQTLKGVPRKNKMVQRFLIEIKDVASLANELHRDALKS